LEHYWRGGRTNWGAPLEELRGELRTLIHFWQKNSLVHLNSFGASKNWTLRAKGVHSHPLQRLADTACVPDILLRGLRCHDWCASWFGALFSWKG
jgi:hypothetical protein